MHTDRPLPQPSDLTQPFWDAAREERLVIQSCGDCGKPIMYPKNFCPACLSEDLTWIESSGKGTVYTFTVQERGAPSGFRDRTPYVIAIIALDEGVQLMSNVVGAGADEVKCGDQVEVAFEAADEGSTVLPVFHLVKG